MTGQWWQSANTYFVAFSEVHHHLKAVQWYNFSHRTFTDCRGGLDDLICLTRRIAYSSSQQCSRLVFVRIFCSREVKRTLRSKKRSYKAAKRADMLALSMDANQLTEYLRGKEKYTEGGQAHLDDLRREVAETMRPDIRIRLRATSRCGEHV